MKELVLFKLTTVKKPTEVKLGTLYNIIYLLTASILCSLYSLPWDNVTWNEVAMEQSDRKPSTDTSLSQIVHLVLENKILSHIFYYISVIWTPLLVSVLNCKILVTCLGFEPVSTMLMQPEHCQHLTSELFLLVIQLVCFVFRTTHTLIQEKDCSVRGQTNGTVYYFRIKPE